MENMGNREDAAGELLLDALSLPTEQRMAFLERACRDAPELHGRTVADPTQRRTYIGRNLSGKTAPCRRNEGRPLCNRRTSWRGRHGGVVQSEGPGTQPVCCSQVSARRPGAGSPGPG